MGLGERLAARMETGTGTIKRIKDGIDENQWSMLFLIRLVPAVPFFVANLLPALVGVPVSRFVITTFLGIIPGAGLKYSPEYESCKEAAVRARVPIGAVYDAARKAAEAVRTG